MNPIVALFGLLWWLLVNLRHIWVPTMAVVAPLAIWKFGWVAGTIVAVVGSPALILAIVLVDMFRHHIQGCPFWRWLSAELAGATGGDARPLMRPRRTVHLDRPPSLRRFFC